MLNPDLEPLPLLSHETLKPESRQNNAPLWKNKKRPAHNHIT